MSLDSEFILSILPVCQNPNMDEVLYVSLALNGVALIAIFYLLWRCFQYRKLCSNPGNRDFNKLQETTPDERRPTNIDQVNDYASVKQSPSNVGNLTQDDVTTNQKSKHLQSTSYDRDVNVVVEDEENVTGPASDDRTEVVITKIIDIDETTNGFSEKTKEVDLRVSEYDVSKPGQDFSEQADDLVKPVPELIDVNKATIELDSATEEEFEEAFDKRHSVASITDSLAAVKQTVNVQVFSKADVPMIRSATNELMTKLNLSDVLLKHTHVPDITNISAEDPLFIICVNTSRLGTDATNAVKGLQHPKSTALLILHHQEKHALPEQRSDRRLRDPQFHGIGGIFDFAYRTDLGMYPCDMNNTCTQELGDFIRRVV